MSTILNSLNGHNFLIFQPILMTLVSKFRVYRVLSDKRYLLLGLHSPLKHVFLRSHWAVLNIFLCKLLGTWKLKFDDVMLATCQDGRHAHK